MDAMNVKWPLESLFSGGGGGGRLGHSGFRRGVVEVFALLGCYGRFDPTFKVKQYKNTEYQSTLRNIPG
jgi:hypothetical protein